jgi:hypothetical protein
MEALLDAGLIRSDQRQAPVDRSTTIVVNDAAGCSGAFPSEALAVTAFAECLYRVGRQALRFPRLQQEGSDVGLVCIGQHPVCSKHVAGELGVS